MCQSVKCIKKAPIAIESAKNRIANSTFFSFVIQITQLIFDTHNRIFSNSRKSVVRTMTQIAVKYQVSFKNNFREITFLYFANSA